MAALLCYDAQIGQARGPAPTTNMHFHINLHGLEATTKHENVFFQLWYIRSLEKGSGSQVIKRGVKNTLCLTLESPNPRDLETFVCSYKIHMKTTQLRFYTGDIFMKKETEQKPFCFVLIPKSKKFLNLWDAAVKPAIEQNKMDALRAEDIVPNYGNLIEGVRKHIINADMIIAVITDEEPAVMYELGFAHSAKKKVIIMAEKESQTLYDFSHIHVFSYDPEDLPKARQELAKWIPSAGKTDQSEDIFPELHIKSKKDVEEYEYLKQTRKTLTIKVEPKNCSIFFNNRLLGKSPQIISVNPDAENNVLSISATAHFEDYRKLTYEDISEGDLEIKMEPKDKEKYPERVNMWLMRRREDPDNPPLSRAIADYLWTQVEYEAAREEAEFCVSKAPEWFAGYNILGIVEKGMGNYEKAKAFF